MSDRDFDLRILKAGSSYLVDARSPEGEEANLTFELPVSAERLEELFRGLGHPRKATRGGASPEVREARDVGRQLFEAVFTHDIRDVFQRSLGGIEARGGDLRIRLHLARSAARFDRDGQLVLLQDQDRSLWDRAAISDAGSLLVRAARLRRPGPYQLQAAIVACHAEAPSWGETDWPQILLLYDRLLDFSPSPTIRLHRAVAVRHVHGPEAAMAEVDTLAVDLARHHLFHAVRAELLRDLARNDEARAADRCALATVPSVKSAGRDGEVRLR